MPILSSLVALEVVMTMYSATSGDKISIMAIAGFSVTGLVWIEITRNTNNTHDLGPLLLIWFNFNPSLDK